MVSKKFGAAPKSSARRQKVLRGVKKFGAFTSLSFDTKLVAAPMSGLLPIFALEY